MLHSSHADGWMDCLFCLLSLPDPTVSLGQGMTWGWIWYSGYTLANYISTSLRAGLTLLYRGIALYPKRAACWGLEWWLPIISKDKKPPTCQGLSLVSGSYFPACNATLCRNHHHFLVSDVKKVSTILQMPGCYGAHREVGTHNKRRRSNFIHCMTTQLQCGLMLCGNIAWIYVISLDVCQI